MILERFSYSSLEILVLVIYFSSVLVCDVLGISYLRFVQDFRYGYSIDIFGLYYMLLPFVFSRY